MRLLILGATGSTGRHLVRHALDRGHEVTALVRDPAKLKPANPRLQVVAGDATSARAVGSVMARRDAVLCVVGPPPSRAATVTVCRDVTAATLDAMQAHGVTRIVCMTAYGTGDSRHFSLSGWLTRKVMPGIMADKDRQEALLIDSDLDWTIVRPPTLVDAAGRGRWRTHERARFRLWDRIAREDVARCMLDQLDDPASSGRILHIRW